MLDTQVSAAEKLEQLQKSLSDLQVKDYVPPMTAQAYDENEQPIPGSGESPEFEFSEAYTDPQKAVALLVEIGQTYMEMNGGKRVNVVSLELAGQIRERWAKPTSERRSKKFVLTA